MEALVASVISASVLLGVLTVFLMTMSSWALGQSRIVMENTARTGTDAIAQQIQGAMRLTVDADKRGLTFELPQRDANGNVRFVFPGPTLGDGLNRRIFYRTVTINGQTVGQIVLQEGATIRVLARNVSLKDPDTGNNINLFEPNVGGSQTGLTITCIVEATSVNGAKTYGRQRETVYLRNIPRRTY